METIWRAELMGWLRATRGDLVVSRFRTRQVGALLAYLAYHCHRSHPRGELVELLWPEREPERGRHELRWALSKLRHQLEPPDVPAGAVIMADRATVQLNPAAVSTDVAQFEAALEAAARAGGDTERLQRLTEAVELYRGALLPGYHEEWVLQARQRLAEGFFRAIRQLTALLEQRGSAAQALEWGRRAVAADPLREEAHSDLIRLLASTGQVAAALRQYRDLKRLLKQELGAVPSPEIRELIRALERRGPRPARTPLEGVIHSPSLPSVLALPDREFGASTSAPTGTVTFLLTEIERPAIMSDRDQSAQSAASNDCAAQLRSTFLRHGGYETCDARASLVFAFERATDAVKAAASADAFLTLQAGAMTSLAGHRRGASPGAGPWRAVRGPRVLPPPGGSPAGTTPPALLARHATEGLPAAECVAGL
jgi:DNA-binding SARP family transcriptional activator